MANALAFLVPEGVILEIMDRRFAEACPRTETCASIVEPGTPAWDDWGLRAPVPSPFLAPSSMQVEDAEW